MALGGGREIGANSFYYGLDGHGLLIDAGLHPEKLGWEAFPKVEALAGHPVDTFIVSHAHSDHLGGVPYLLQSYPNTNLYATSETIELARIMLANSASLLPKQHPQEVLDKLPNYTVDSLPETFDKMRPMELGSSHLLNGSEIKATLYASGHILGAAGIL